MKKKAHSKPKSHRHKERSRERSAKMHKLISLPFLIVSIIILAALADLSAATSAKVNASFDAAAECGGAVNCLIGDDLEAELAIHTRVARMLYDLSSSSSGNTGSSNKASVSGCSGSGYRSCLPSKNGGSGCKSQYDRTC